MGQTLSYDSGTRKLHLTTDVPGDLVSQVLLLSSGLVPSDITPAPGWTVLPGPVLRFRPALGSPKLATFDYTPIATLSKTPSINSIAALTPLTAADAVDDSEPWITRPFEAVNLSTAYTILAQPYVSIARGLNTLIAVEASRQDVVTVWTVSPSTASVIGGYLVSNGDFDVGSTLFSVTGTAGELTDTVDVMVEVVDGLAVSPLNTLSAVHGGDAPLVSNLFDFDDVTVTNVAMITTDSVGVTTANGENHVEPSEVLIDRDDLENSAISVVANREMLEDTKSILSTDCIDYYASIDGGLSYVHTGQLCLNTIPCFEVSARVRVGLNQWKRADSLRSGDLVLDANNRWQRVVQVAISPPALVAAVTISQGQMGALRDVTFSRTHRVRMPNGRVAPALYAPFARHAMINTQMCHVETFAYCMLMVEGVIAESWARTRAQYKQRAKIDNTYINGNIMWHRVHVRCPQQHNVNAKHDDNLLSKEARATKHVACPRREQKASVAPPKTRRHFTRQRYCLKQ